MSVYVGQEFTFEREGVTFLARIHAYNDHGAPWEECDGHCAVERVSTPYYGRIKKKPSQVILHEGSRNEWSYLVDFAESVRIAKRDGWNTAPHNLRETKGQRAVRAVLADLEFLRGWCADHWQYVGITVQLCDDEGGNETDYSHALWGCESIGDYVRDEVAHKLADEIISEMRAEQKCSDTERDERSYWESRDVVTEGA
jgi:hypothetical protein